MVDPQVLGRLLPPLADPEADSARQALAAASRLRRFADGAWLVREGDPSDTLLGIVTGEAEVLRHFGEAERVVARLGPESLLGETGIVQGLRRTASVRARGPVAAVEMPAAAFRDALGQAAGLAVWLIEGQMRRLAERETAYLASLRRALADRDKALAELRLAQGRDATPAEAPPRGVDGAADPFVPGAVWCPSLEPLLHRARRLAASDLPVLILGEPGTGKDLLARYVHAASGRAAGPFEAINCAAIPAEIAEAELFGVRRGAFTGADRDRAGVLQRAHGGTLFLDEVAELPPAVQAKLLRALEDGSVQPLGGGRSRRVDVRIVAATNRDIAEAVQQGRFREDLRYRVDGARLTLPPLRSRRDHIPRLAQAFAARAAPEVDPAFALDGVMPILLRYPFPGNVRELLHALRAALALTETYPRLQVADLPEPMQAFARQAGGWEADAGAGAGTGAPSSSGGSGGGREVLWTYMQEGSLPKAVRRITRELLEMALEASGGVRKDAAAALGISPQNLANYLRRYGA